MSKSFKEEVLAKLSHPTLISFLPRRYLNRVLLKSEEFDNKVLQMSKSFKEEVLAKLSHPTPISFLPRRYLNRVLLKSEEFDNKDSALAFEYGGPNPRTRRRTWLENLENLQPGSPGPQDFGSREDQQLQ
mmetsp:Transcript_11377/g.27431  ORF Transcript_11377/g.27431 Transcript_11377/m.27431 type:complete len:130 (+) Transcript_11377:574-963(+)